jgi:antitoxin ParD1/3/4
MTISLPPDVAKILASQVAAGTYASTDDALRAAAYLLERQAEHRIKVEKLRQSLQESIDQADRGELLDGDEVFDEVLRELTEASKSELQSA